MEIKKANIEIEYKECFEFIKNIWKDEFEIDFDLNLEKQYQSFIKSDIYFIEEKWKIIAIIQLTKVEKWFKLKDWFIPKNDCYFLWRIWVLKEYRNKWYWSKLIKYWINQIENTWIKTIYTLSEINNINYYSNFWFKKINDNIKNVWNTNGVYMERKT